MALEGNLYIFTELHLFMNYIESTIIQMVSDIWGLPRPRPVSVIL